MLASEEKSDSFTVPFCDLTNDCSSILINFDDTSENHDNSASIIVNFDVASPELFSSPEITYRVDLPDIDDELSKGFEFMDSDYLITHSTPSNKCSYYDTPVSSKVIYTPPTSNENPPQRFYSSGMDGKFKFRN